MIKLNQHLSDASRPVDAQSLQILRKSWNCDEPGVARYSASLSSAAILVVVSGLRVAVRHSAIVAVVAIVVKINVKLSLEHVHASHCNL